MGKQRLELTWIGKNTRPKLEPRILIEDPEKSFGTSETENMLIHGDNLLALKALEQEYAGKVKCIFIDPPYNTGNAFEHYDDGLEHSIWLSLLRDRLIILHKLLTEEGSIWVSIDDNECHYLKIVMDEIFGRPNFISSIAWQSRYSRSNDSAISLSHNHILIYSKNPQLWKLSRNRLERSPQQEKQYKNPDNDPNGPWRAIPWDAPNIRENLEYTIMTPKGTPKKPPVGRHWSRTEDQWLDIVEKGLAYFGKNEDGAPSFKQYLKDAPGIIPNTWWGHEESGHTDEAKKEIYALFGSSNAFDTPKPERLIKRIVEIASNPGDIVLDSFLGSGTTAAVAHKMGRRWIGIELGDHCYTHCKPRLDKVVSGEDQGGISQSFNWKGGGGYKFYELAPSLLNKDTYGNWIINKEYNADMLAAAMAKQEGFRYSPDSDIYWKQGQSTEQDFIFTTTEFLTQEHVEYIHSQMKEGESLLICCKAFNANDSHFPNITIKKIPKMLMGKCEFGKDDYSLNIINIPMDDNEEDFPDSVSEPKPKYVAGQAELFDLEGDNE